MVKQYPHTVILSTVADGTQDGSGNLVPGSASSTTISGRFEPNSGSRFIKGADGSQIVYDGIIYVSVSTVTVALGTTVEVKNGNETIAKGTVKNFSKGQLNARVWI